MKKFITMLLLVISMFSFFILYNQQKTIQLFNMENSEHHLRNSYQVTIPTRINVLPRGQQYEKILETTKGQVANLYLSRLDDSNEQQKIIKYIYTTNNDYINQFHLIWGEKLDKSLMDTDYFLSTDNTGDKNQIGQIASFDGIHLEIHTLHSMLDQGLFLDGPCTVTIPDGKNISFFTKSLENGIGVKSIDTSAPGDIGRIFPQSTYFEILILFFMIMLLILYDILKSYKKIAVEKLLGFSTLNIWKKRISKIIIIQIITIIISMIIMSLALFKRFNINYLYFLEDAVIMYIALILFMLITASIPFLYVNNIKITAIIKNNQPIKEILFLNSLIKVLLCVGFIFLVNKQFVNYNNIKMAFDGTYKSWDNASNYKVLNLNKINMAIGITDDKNVENNIEIYKYFNKRGALFADFSLYTKLSLGLNKQLPPENHYALVNPNYLNENQVYDIYGKRVSISEDDKNWIILVPDKNKKDEKEIREFHKRFLDGSYKDNSNRKIEIIWIKSNQKFFSYNFMVNPNNGNYVTDPIFLVGTESGGAYRGWDAQLFNIDGNPFKVKLDGKKTAEEFIKPELNKYGLLSYGLQINNANEEEPSSINDYKNMFTWLVTGMTSIIIVIAIILIQNIYNYFEQFKVRLAIRQLHGYKKIEKYKEYFLLLIITWIIIATIAFIFSLAIPKVILGVSAAGFILELIVSLIVLINYIERKKIIEFIKGGA